MVGITALSNSRAPQGRQISLFYNLTNNNLALQQRNEGNGSDQHDDSYASSSTDQAGWIENPSQVASADFNGISVIFGFTAQKAGSSGGGNTDHDVSILSPVYKPVGSTLKTNTTIAAAVSDTTASVFYLTGGKGNTIHIEEKTLGEQNPISWKGHAEILDGSSLAAYYALRNGEPARRVIFQTTDDSNLHDFEPGAGYVTISHANAKDKSPLAVTVVGKKAYLYYVNQHDSLQKVVKSDIANPDSWGGDNAVEGARKVHPESQITVTSSGGYNHIFYVAGDSKHTTFEHIKDLQ